MKPVVNLYNLGRTPYVRALKVQQILFDKLKQNVTQPPKSSKHCNNDVLLNPTNNISFMTNDNPVSHVGSSIFRSFPSEQPSHPPPPSSSSRANSLILVEHEPVYTVGIRTNNYNDSYVLKLKEELDKHHMKADFLKTNRGGLITFHGPGQLVAYPIIYLGDFTSTIPNKSVKAYVSRLESTIIDTLKAAGLEGAHTMREYPGVWLDDGDRKIAFIGISCRRYVTMHGISINCDCDLSWFDYIVSCGIEDKSITSIHQELTLKDGQHLSSETISSNLTVESSKPSSIASDACTQLVSPKRSKATSKQELFGLKEGRSKYNVQHIANIFCKSFSVNFDCDLRHADVDEDIGEGLDALSLECQH